MTDLLSMHVIECKEQLVDDIGTVLLIKSLTLIDLGLHLAALVEWHD